MQKRLLAVLLVLQALIMIVLFFILPLFASIVGAFEVGDKLGLGNFCKSLEPVGLLDWCGILIALVWKQTARSRLDGQCDLCVCGIA